MSPVERRLREELDEAREEIRQLRELMLPRARVPDDWRLTAQETLLFRSLLGRDEVSYEAAAQAMSFGAEPVCIDQVKVVAYRVRRKTKPFDVRITTIWGVGLQLSDRRAWRDRLADLLAERCALVSGYPVLDTPTPIAG